MKNTLLINSVFLSTTLAFGESSTRPLSVPTAEIKPSKSTQLPDDTDWLTCSTLTGDWRGTRSSLASNGVTLDFRHTSIYQGLMSGTRDKYFELGNKMI